MPLLFWGHAGVGPASPGGGPWGLGWVGVFSMGVSGVPRAPAPAVPPALVSRSSCRPHTPQGAGSAGTKKVGEVVFLQGEAQLSFLGEAPGRGRVLAARPVALCLLGFG